MTMFCNLLILLNKNQNLGFNRMSSEGNLIEWGARGEGSNPFTDPLVFFLQYWPRGLNS
jgi:hypothetical protein